MQCIGNILVQGYYSFPNLKIIFEYNNSPDAFTWRYNGSVQLVFHSAGFRVFSCFLTSVNIILYFSKLPLYNFCVS